jgi:quercetin dioxygenase-like cupin family protein
MNESVSILLKRGEGESFWVLGDYYTFKATGKDTDGRYTVIDQIIQPQNGPPPHIHQREDEAFYVLDGKFSFLSGKKESQFEAGSFIYIPKGTLHTFKNIGEEQGRLLVFITPAGLEEFFYAIGTPASQSSSPPTFDPVIFDRLIKLASEYKMEILIPEPISRSGKYGKQKAPD